MIIASMSSTLRFRIGQLRFYLPGSMAVLLLLTTVSTQGQQGKTAVPFAAEPLTEKGDLSSKMVEGINNFLLQETGRVKDERKAFWKRDFSTVAAFEKSITSQRQLLAHELGVIEKRVTPGVEVISDNHLKQYRATVGGCRIYAVRWNAIDGVSAEGLLMVPAMKILARMVMLPDADGTPEALAGMEQPGAPGFASAVGLANAGIEILIPALINRDFRYSGNPGLNRYTQQPHREWIYRQAYAVGRHVIGYELQKIFAAIDWFESLDTMEGKKLPVGIAGYGEGGLLALYASALDPRIDASLISGYFDAREQLWQEPIYRNVSGLLKTFGDAELAAMTWPKPLVIEQSKGPVLIHNNPDAAPGRLVSPSHASAENEFMRGKALLPATFNKWNFVAGSGKSQGPFSVRSLKIFLSGLGVKWADQKKAQLPDVPSTDWLDNQQRQARQVREMEKHVQHVLAICERTRNDEFWSKMKGDVNAQQEIREQERDRFWEVLGKLPVPQAPLHIRARIYQESSTWTSYEVMLDVFTPGVFAWGILVVPKNIKPGERRPVVVCQHGLEGLPEDVVNTDSTSENYHYYKGYATRLAERGYITFAPHNPYRGGDKFRSIQRKANPLGLTLFSVIISQHQAIVRWLQQLDFVDPGKIAFYGLSYGGKTAMRVPAIVKGYALSICSADFNEWVRKVATVDYDFGYIYTGEYDMPEWDLGHTFNYAEMAALIAPRPFMVERGHFDGVGTDEWVSYEYGKVKRYYDLLGVGKATQIEFFNGPHTINGKGTFEFLDTYLRR